MKLAGLNSALVHGTAGSVPITTRRSEPWISIQKLTALPEPGNLAAVKDEVRAVPQLTMPAGVGHQHCHPRRSASGLLRTSDLGMREQVVVPADRFMH